MSPRLKAALRNRRIVGTGAAVLSALIVIPAGVALGATFTADPAAAATAPDVTALTGLSDKDYTYDGQPADALLKEPKAARRAAMTASAATTPALGTTRNWVAIDDFQGRLYLKPFVLKGVGDHIEVWVTTNTAFPATDCRNNYPGSTTITQDQVDALIHEFDTNMYPKETATFSTPPDRDGSNNLLGLDFSGGGEKTVALIDNVRDANYYQFGTPAGSTYIAGFFSSTINEYVDRNVMTIDAYDWAHRTGANPPNQPTNDPCTSRPARPRLYEGTFAHEWQHLLQYYQDPAESTWMNEGLSDFAQTLVGYVNTKLTINDPGNDSHTQCYQGWEIVQTPANPNPLDCGGPQNSLNLWNEGPAAGVLADYGHAYSFITYLYDHFGVDFISALHSDGSLQGLASVDALLRNGEGTDVYTVLHNFQTSTLLDRQFDGGVKPGVEGVDPKLVTSAELNSAVNLANPQSYADPGAAPNGADYVLLKDASGKPLSGNALRSLTLSAAATLAPIPLQWTEVDGSIWSGDGDAFDAAAILPVTVPTSDPTLTFDSSFGMEGTYDYGYVVVSTDGGATYTAIAGDATVDGPFGPALNGGEQLDHGVPGTFNAYSFDLSAYAGQSILLGFRYVADPAVTWGGWYVKNIAVGGTVVADGSSTAPFKSATEIKPVGVYNVHLRLVGIDTQPNHARVLDRDGNVSLTRTDLDALSPFDQVVAIVSYDEPTESVNQYVPYQLTVNGVLQAGGA